MNTSKKGFTILELLVVIAIIGILSAVTLAFIGNSRSKAKIASVQKTMSSIMPVVISCIDEGSDINPMEDEVTGGGFICEGNVALWPELAGGWTYDTPPVFDISLSAFSFGASDADGNSILCTESTGCVTTLES